MNQFGRLFNINIFGESHGNGVGVLIDGCPAGLDLITEDFLLDLSKRKSGAKGTTPRKEEDFPIIESGVFNDKTTGAPILIKFDNQNTHSKDYSNLIRTPRPGHSDFVAYKKYKGFNDYRGGGHFSGRLTLGLVAAGVIAKKLIHPINIAAQIIEVGGQQNYDSVIEEALKTKDSVGGIIECVATNMPTGLGDPFFNSIESSISHLAFSIPAIKGIEFGAGFKAAKMKGSEHNDTIVDISGKTLTNNAGGINGGISNGNDLVFRIAIKPTSSIATQQATINIEKKEIEDLVIKGRHDACIALRVPVIVEAITAISLADFTMVG